MDAAIIRLTEHSAAPVQLTQDLGAAAVLLQLEPEATQLELRLEPQAVILGLLQCIQCQPIEVLHKQQPQPSCTIIAANCRCCCIGTFNFGPSRFGRPA